jgi:predicted phosphodiesterase
MERFTGTVLLFLALVPLTAKASKTSYRNCKGSIRHVHLAVGNDPATSMTVSFSTTDSAISDPVAAAILIGTDPGRLHSLVREDEDSPVHYEAMQPRSIQNYTSPYQHHISLSHLEPDTTYYYQCIVRPKRDGLNHLEKIIQQNFEDDRDSNEKEELIATEVNEQFEEQTYFNGHNGTFYDGEHGTQNGNRRQLLQARARQQENHLQYLRRLAPPPYDSTQCKCPDPNQIRSFTTAPLPGTMPESPLKFAIIGDIGQFAHSEETLYHLIQKNARDISAVMLAGDLAYSEGDHHRWDTFMDFLDDYPIAASVPLMVCPGNHDIDKAASGHEIFEAYESRFRMPRIQSAKKAPIRVDGLLNMDSPPYPLPYDYGNAYYSFTWGPARYVVLNSYSAMGPGSIMYNWLVSELEAVDRTVTPWLFVMYHCPIYNTFREHQRDTQIIQTREHLEPLFIQYKVNIIFNGHVHAYLRTVPVARNVPTRTGPIHIVMGAGGRDAKADFLADDPEVWVATRDATIYGYGLLEIYNSTHLRWDWIHTGLEETHVHNTVYGEDVAMPAGGVDAVLVKNQYFVED